VVKKIHTQKKTQRQREVNESSRLSSKDVIYIVVVRFVRVLMSNSSLKQEEYLFYLKEWSKRYTQKHKNTDESLLKRRHIYTVVVCYL
jgi:hypothetical protein